MPDTAIQQLTSNIPGHEVPEVLGRMQLRHDAKDSLSLLLCTNMLSVGVDVGRLGIMVVNGQPKSTAEYIQASSRVGRSAVPGLVVTHHLATKARDRSHYEAFESYHAALYRDVEPTSVTPFSAPARARALHAALVIMVRHLVGLRLDNQAEEFHAGAPAVQEARALLLARVQDVDPDEGAQTAIQLDRLIEEWAERTGHEPPLRYRQDGKTVPGLLKRHNQSGQGWATLNSMRNVDATCEIEVRTG